MGNKVLPFVEVGRDLKTQALHADVLDAAQVEELFDFGVRKTGGRVCEALEDLDDLVLDLPRHFLPHSLSR